jgi:hypothetical protein
VIHKREKVVNMGMSDAECKRLGLRMAHGQVWHSGFCRDDEVTMVFMILALMGKEDLEKLIADGVVAFWEDMSKASPSSVNGMPIFFSCHTLTKDDNTRVIRAYNDEVAMLRDLDAECAAGCAATNDEGDDGQGG